MADDDRLALLSELERSDEAIMAELAELDELYAAVEDLRERAVELASSSLASPKSAPPQPQAVQEAERALAEARTTAGTPPRSWRGPRPKATWKASQLRVASSSGRVTIFTSPSGMPLRPVSMPPRSRPEQRRPAGSWASWRHVRGSSQQR